MPQPRTNTVPTLNSWKEIAAYLARGVRTVQRWERDLQLPIHRIGRGPRSPVCALPTELDAWLQRMSGHIDFRGQRPNLPKRSPDTSVAVSRLLVNRSTELVQRMLDTTWAHRKQTESLQRKLVDMQRLLKKSRKFSESVRENHVSAERRIHLDGHLKKLK